VHACLLTFLLLITLSFFYLSLSIVFVAGFRVSQFSSVSLLLSVSLSDRKHERCQMTQERLKQDYPELKGGDPCPVCDTLFEEKSSFLVGSHPLAQGSSSCCVSPFLCAVF
jgi:hypothetical protein